MTEPRQARKMDSPRISDKKPIFSNEFLTLYSVAADFGSHTREYFVTECGERVGVLATRDDSVLLVRQYRFLLGGLSWEIPGGRVDTDETPETAARREFLEETGHNCGELEPLLSYEAGMDTRHNPTTLFHASGASGAEKIGDVDGETIEAHWVPFERCMEMVFAGEIADVFTITALFAYHIRHRDGWPNRPPEAHG